MARIGVEERVRLREIEEKAKLEEALKEAEKKSPFRNFAQLNREQLPHIVKACGECPGAMKVFFFIMQHMDKYNALACPYKVFQEQLDMSQATVARNIKYLKDKGFLAVLKTGTNNVYVLNDNLTWTSKGGNLKYSRFPGGTPLSAAGEGEIKQAKKLKFERVTVAANSE